MTGAVASFLLPLAVLAASSPAVGPRADWADTAEAVFLTKAERGEWKKARSEEERERFKESYWNRRDPTPGTERNEFRQRIAARIAAADARFSTGGRSGSETRRGHAYVLLGAPGIVRQTLGPTDMRPELGPGGRPFIRRENFHAMTWEVWVYDRETTPDVVESLARPSLELPFVIDPGGPDRLNDRGLFEAIRQRLARESIAGP